MNLTQHSVRLGLAMAGAAVVITGGTVAATMAGQQTPTRSTAAQPAQDINAGMAMAAAPASPSTPPPAPTTGSTTPAAVPATQPAPVTMAQAVSLAERSTHAQLDSVDSDLGPAGAEWKVKLVRSDGSEVKVYVVTRTGRLMTELQHDQAEATQPEAPATPDAPDTPDTHLG